MPVYKVKPEQNTPTAMSDSPSKKKRYPTVSVPVSPEIIAALEVGGEVEVVLKGTVSGLESRQSSENDPWSNRNELRVELRTVEAYPAKGAKPAEEDEAVAGDDMLGAITKGLGYEKNPDADADVEEEEAA